MNVTGDGNDSGSAATGEPQRVEVVAGSSPSQTSQGKGSCGEDLDNPMSSAKAMLEKQAQVC